MNVSIRVATTNGLSVRGARFLKKAKAQTRCAFAGSPYFSFVKLTQQRLNLTRCYARALEQAMAAREIFHHSRASTPSCSRFYRISRS